MKPATDCDPMRVALTPYLDGELDAAERAAFERHVESCVACREALSEARALGAAFRLELPRTGAPAELSARIQAGLAAAESRPSGRSWYWRAPALAAAALVLLLIGAGASQWLVSPTRDPMALREAIAAHVRALVSDRLTDVASSDQHTVKPWFEGRVELAPPVEDLTSDGFRLVGGRVDYIGGHRVAALVYRHRQHVLTLFVGPAATETGRFADQQGYRVVHWRRGDLGYWAVSDLNLADLEHFAQLMRARLASN